MTKIICDSRRLQTELKTFLKSPFPYDESISFSVESKKLTVESGAYRVRFEMDVETNDADDKTYIDAIKVMALEKLLRFVQQQPLVLIIKHGEFVVQHIEIY